MIIATPSLGLILKMKLLELFLNKLNSIHSSMKTVSKIYYIAQILVSFFSVAS